MGLCKEQIIIETTASEHEFITKSPQMDTIQADLGAKMVS